MIIYSLKEYTSLIGTVAKALTQFLEEYKPNAVKIDGEDTFQKQDIGKEGQKANIYHYFASKLEINLEGVNIQISEIKRKNEELQNEINKYENSMAFQWYTKDTKEQKQNFLQFCLGVFKGNQS